MHQETTHSRPATSADLHRLARVAHERGLRLYRERASGAWFCTSASTPEEIHYVTGFSCTCRGFVRRQRCTHHALLLERLGWLPTLAVSASAPTTCVWCRGCGLQENPGVNWLSIGEMPCSWCDGTGVRTDYRPQAAPALVPVAAAA